MRQKVPKELVGDYMFSRQWDDQLAVTIIPAMEDPARAWRLRSHNFIFNINHHKAYDGKVETEVKGYDHWRQEIVRDKWHARRLLCDYYWK